MYHLCSAGWLANRKVGYPTAFSAPKCGGGVVGIIDYGIRENKSETWDVFCYRVKGRNSFTQYYRIKLQFVSTIPFLLELSCRISRLWKTCLFGLQLPEIYSWWNLLPAAFRPILRLSWRVVTITGNDRNGQNDRNRQNASHLLTTLI